MFREIDFQQWNINERRSIFVQIAGLWTGSLTRFWISLSCKPIDGSSRQFDYSIFEGSHRHAKRQSSICRAKSDWGNRVCGLVVYDGSMPLLASMGDRFDEGHSRGRLIRSNTIGKKNALDHSPVAFGSQYAGSPDLVSRRISRMANRSDGERWANTGLSSWPVRISQSRR